MCLQNLMLIVTFLTTILISTLFAEEPLELSSTEESHSVGYDQNMLGINSYNKKKISESKLIQQHNCDNNPKNTVQFS